MSVGSVQPKSTEGPKMKSSVYVYSGAWMTVTPVKMEQWAQQGSLVYQALWSIRLAQIRWSDTDTGHYSAQQYSHKYRPNNTARGTGGNITAVTLPMSPSLPSLPSHSRRRYTLSGLLNIWVVYLTSEWVWPGISPSQPKRRKFH